MEDIGLGHKEYIPSVTQWARRDPCVSAVSGWPDLRLHHRRTRFSPSFRLGLFRLGYGRDFQSQLSGVNFPAPSDDAFLEEKDCAEPRWQTGEVTPLREEEHGIT